MADLYKVDKNCDKREHYSLIVEAESAVEALQKAEQIPLEDWTKGISWDNANVTVYKSKEK